MTVWLILLGVMVACLIVCLIAWDEAGIAIFGFMTAVLLLGGGIYGLLHLIGAVA